MTRTYRGIRRPAGTDPVGLTRLNPAGAENVRWTLLIPPIAMFMLACGDGGELPLPPPILESTSPASIVQQQGTPETLRSTATLLSSATETRFELEANPGVIEGDRASFDRVAEGFLGTAVGTRADLTPGEYTAKYRLQVCRDDRCSLSNELTHTVTVVPVLQVRLVGGRCNSFCTYWLVPTGANIVATSNVPVAWNLTGDPSTPVQFLVVSSTPTRWEAVTSGMYSVAVASTATLTASALQQPTFRSSSAAHTFFAMPPQFY